MTTLPRVTLTLGLPGLLIAYSSQPLNRRARPAREPSHARAYLCDAVD